MRGSTRKRGSSWTAYWDDYDVATGERRQRSRGGFATRRDAQRHLAGVVVAVNEGSYSEPSKQPLGRFLVEEWLPAVKSTVRPLTYTNYAARVRSVTKYPIAAVPLRALSGGHLTALYGELERDGLSVGTRRFTHSVLRRALNDAVRWGKLTRNPAAAADPPAASRSKVRAWSDRELRTFLAHVEGDRLQGLWRLAATTGMRRGELLGLTWRHLDLDGARLRVEQQLLPTAGGLTFGPPKSARSERTVALDAGTADALRHHRATQQLERELAGDVYRDGDLVFCNEIGEPVHPQALTAMFTSLRKAAGIPSGSLHVLRHTAATIALTRGIPLHVVAGRLGDRAETLLATYAHLLPHSDEVAAETIAAVLVAADVPSGVRVPPAWSTA
ncbi:MAG TPA: tyrosine-type recombinase/integrase [Solirubrobacteraceae bacterium]|jgi:integrase|nr:tyrosine-type recombinase/integrase [Solirubrobacteraceae bacterium]